MCQLPTHFHNVAKQNFCHPKLQKSNMIHYTTTNHQEVKKWIEEPSDGVVRRLPHSRYQCRWRQMDFLALVLAVSHCVGDGNTRQNKQQRALSRLCVSLCFGLSSQSAHPHSHSQMQELSIICKATCARWDSSVLVDCHVPDC